MASLKTTKFKYVLSVQNKQLSKAFGLAKSRWGEFPGLIIAIDNNFMELIKLLIENGWNVNETRARDRATPLHAAAASCNVEVVRLLLQHGADRSMTDVSHLTPLARNLKSRIWGKSLGVYQALTEGMMIEEFCERNDRGESLLHVMSRNRTVPFNIYEEIIGKGVNVNAREQYFGRTFLMDMIIFYDCEQMVVNVASLAMKEGLLLNRKDMYGNSVMHRIASEERTVMMEWACNIKGFKIGMRNKNDQTPLYIAVRRGNLDIIKLLYKMGETVDGDAWEFRGSSVRKSMIEVAEYREHWYIARILRKEIEGERDTRGLFQAKPLMALAKGAIRDTLAKQGMNIYPKLAGLELPRTLQQYLVELDCDV